jgi:hypothetical protein
MTGNRALAAVRDTVLSHVPYGLRRTLIAQSIQYDL